MNTRELAAMLDKASQVPLIERLDALFCALGVFAIICMIMILIS